MANEILSHYSILFWNVYLKNKWCLIWSVKKELKKTGKRTDLSWRLTKTCSAMWNRFNFTRKTRQVTFLVNKKEEKCKKRLTLVASRFQWRTKNCLVMWNRFETQGQLCLHMDRDLPTRTVKIWLQSKLWSKPKCKPEECTSKYQQPMDSWS